MAGSSGGGNRRITSHNHGFRLFKALKDSPFYGGVLGRFIAFAQNDYNNNSLTNRVCNNFTDTVFSRFTSLFSLKCAVNNQNSKVAFTLAEILITLGIIGVVAAMTMPALIQNHNKKVLETGLKKSYSVISQAVQMYIEDNQEIPSHQSIYLATEANNAFVSEFFKYFKVVKYCSNKWSGSSAACIAGDSFSVWFNNTYKTYSKKSISNISHWWFDDGMYILEDGSFIFLDNSTSENILVSVDINGKKASNALGHDLFLFAIDHETGKVRPYGGETLSNREDTKLCDKNATSELNGLSCTSVAFENMDEYFENYLDFNIKKDSY